MDLNLTGSILANVSLIQPSTSVSSAFSALLNSQLLGVAIGGLISFFTTSSIEKRKEKQEQKQLLRNQYTNLFDTRKKAYVEFLNFIEAEERYGKRLSPEEWMSKLTRMGAQILIYGSKKIAREMSRGFTPDLIGKTAPALYDVREIGNEFRRKVADMIIEEMAAINVTRISDNWLEETPSEEEARVKNWWRFWR